MKKRGSKTVSTFLAAALFISLAGPGGWAAAEESSPAAQPAPGLETAGGDGAGADTAQAEGNAAGTNAVRSVDAAGTGGSADQTLLAADDGLGISAQNLPQAVVGTPYSATIAVYGGEPPYGFAADGLPTGLALDAVTGMITGTPAAGTEGSYEIKVTLTDSAAEPGRAEAALQLTVAKAAAGQEPAPLEDTLQIRKIATYSVGTPNEDGGVAEIVKYNKDNGKFYLVNGSSEPPSIDIVPLAETGTLMKEKTVDVVSLAEKAGGFTFGDLTSLDINTATKRIAAAVQEADPAKAGKILVLDYEGNLLDEYEAGVQPDMVKYTSDGRYILTADEGEPREAGIDPEGSVTVVDTVEGQTRHVKFDDPSVIDDLVHIRGMADADGMITGSGSKEDAVFDLEPEYIALSSDETTAYVSLQENNAIAAIDIGKAKVLYVRGLGFKDLNDPDNALDLIEDQIINLENVPFKGMYMPDGIDAHTVGGKTYLFTANEGDATEWPGRTNVTKIKKLTSVDPDSEAGRFLQENGSRYGDVETASDMGADGVYLYGARSFSVWDADTMQQVYDSGNDFERVTAERLPDYFNSNHSKANFDKRSPKKGPEPEYVTVGQVGSKAFAFTGLERIGGVMVYDVTDPENPAFASYTNTRDFNAGLNTDTGPEGLEFVPATESPTGLPLLLTANEVSGTVAVLELEVTKVSLDKTSLTLTAGGAAEKLTATVTPAGGPAGSGEKVVWSSSDSSVVAVDADGTVTPVAAGQAVITALSEDGYGVAEAKVTVQSAQDGGDTWKLTVMHTNDSHAHLDDVARRAMLVKQIRAEGGDSLLLDAGDVFSGDLYFTKWQGLKDLEFMNLMGYDAMTFGNHEFDKGTGVLADFINKAQFPLVSSNIDFSKDGNIAPLVKSPANIDVSAPKTTEHAGVYPYVVLEAGGHKVGVFGLITEDTAVTSSPGKDVTFNEAVQAAEATVAAMEQDGLNIIIGLSHLGYARDQKLAAEVEGIDLIVGGHTHTKLDAPEIVTDSVHQTPTVIVQANEWGKYLGRVDLVFDEQGQVLTGPGQTSGSLVPVNGQVAEDAAAKTILDPLKAELEELKKQVIGTAAVVLDGERVNVRSKETNLGNLIADGMLAKAQQLKGAQIAIMNGGGIRASIDQGEITMGELRTVMPFGNTLYVLDVTGQQLKDGLENGISGAKLTDLPGKFPQIAGMKFKWDPAQPAGSRVFDVQIKQGDTYVPLNLSSTYRLATNSFVANGGDGYSSFAAAIAAGAYHEDLGYPDYEIFIENIEQLGGTVSPVVEGRIVEQAKPSGDGSGGNGGGSGGGKSSSGSKGTISPGASNPSGESSSGNAAYELVSDMLQVEVTRGDDGQTVNQVSVKPDVLKTALAAAASSSQSELAVELTDLGGGTVLSLPAETLLSVNKEGTENSEVTLVIRTALASYRLPLQAIIAGHYGLTGSDALSSSGSGASIQISILSAKTSEQAEIAKAAANQGVTLTGSAAVEFKVVLLTVDGQEREITAFGNNTYLSRTIPLPAEVDSNAVTAVMYDKAAGKLVFVPAVKVTVDGKPALELKRPGNSLYTLVSGKKHRFADVNGHWAEQAVDKLASKLLVEGVGETRFEPGREMTRAEFTALLVRGLGLTPTQEANVFSDVEAGNSLAGEIAAAVEFGLVTPDATGAFKPNERITRAEMAVMVAKAMRLVKDGNADTDGEMSAGTSADTALLARFTDRLAIPDWAAADVAWLVEQGIMQGDNRGAFAPNGHTTRAQAAILLMRMLQELRFID
ncbi:multifunctional 2',3'-cyclic-nucleotide 2'-phosphodiesterase/5'-nucleotidase/3'-nucleotidase [Paenibacillus oralis]|uniref:Multifunctional 2',3'-cyclic-nucleotide 2'-phosphodiesterase/5'-nucleotidase/3'-nucleotidase n=1 Tax=Paenibacillus oralis TaxID=2490856 RepID=A0A3P3U3P5_9BACL|nr:choice-of-anchor I family protein [Paenibacillus oralis]RRJ64178.1 multifunctional 2',3'-cyclic-nucleotide 2'-phosphodiesterase/5'-nucleotidase/3'-nucleotidase [Paenibacillus oralis]